MLQRSGVVNESEDRSSPFLLAQLILFNSLRIKGR